MKPYRTYKTGELYCGDCIDILREIPDHSVDLIITSPPYNCGKEYEQQLTEKEYLIFSTNWILSIKRVLRKGGRLAINIAGTSTNNGIWTQLLQIMFVALWDVLPVKDVIVWNQKGSDNNCAWGSFLSASSPSFRHQNEYIILCYKDIWHHGKGISTFVSSKEFQYLTTDNWEISPEKDRTHPAPFPVLLATDLIKILSFKNDLILDPFIGSGTTAVAAIETDRRFIGVDTSEKYCEIADSRILQAYELKRQTEMFK